MTGGIEDGHQGAQSVGPVASPGAPDREAPDSVLAELARNGDNAAFGLIYERYAPRLFDFLVRMLRNQASAEDLTQTTFLRALERRETLREPSKVRGWLYSIAYHLAMTRLAAGKYVGSSDTLDLAVAGDASPEDEALSADAADLVWAAAASLEPRQYAVLDMVVRRDLDTNEIAEVLDVTTNHAAVLVHRAKVSLRGAVESLLVARSRSRCERLAELMPISVRTLDAAQRSTVDHHMRRCETCKKLATRLSKPEALLAALVPAALPGSLLSGGWAQVLAGHSLAESGAPTAHPPDSPSSHAQHGPVQVVTTRGPTRRGLRRWMYPAIASAAAAAALVAILLAYFLSGGPTLTSATSLVPNVIGSSIEQATHLLSERGFGTRVVKRHASSPAGVVVAQQPLSGKRYRLKATVTIDVSTGPSVIAVPQLAGETIREVRATLNSADLRLGGLSYLPSSLVPLGEAMSSYPPAGTFVPRGYTVSVLVSSGPPTTKPPTTTTTTKPPTTTTKPPTTTTTTKPPTTTTTTKPPTTTTTTTKR